MIELPETPKQPTDTSCLPTAVRAIIRWHLEQDASELEVTQSTVSEWCGERAGGCLLDQGQALDGVDEAGFPFTMVTGPSTQEEEAVDIIRTWLTGEEPRPVLAIVADPNSSDLREHAIVLLGIGEKQTEPGEHIWFYDPFDGGTTEKSLAQF